MTDVAAAYSRKYYEVQDHFVILRLLSAPFHGYVNPKWYEGLSDKLKAALEKVGKTAAAFTVKLSEETVSKAPENFV